MHVVGVLVAFDLLRNPIDIAESVSSVLDHLIIVDNAPGGHPFLTKGGDGIRYRILANGNVDGLAGAYNRAIDCIRNDHPNATHILFIDDDTDTSSVAAFLDSEITRQYCTRCDVAAVAPAYVDRETGLRGAHIQLSRFRYRHLPRNLAVPTEVAFLINSLSLWSVGAISRIGGYNVRLKIDHIDTDYCLRAARAGYSLILNSQVSFLHSIGKRRTFRLFGMTMQAGGHSPARRAMIACNTVMLAKHFGVRMPAFAALCAMRLVYECVGILMAENAKLAKLRAVIVGSLTGIFSRYA